MSTDLDAFDLRLLNALQEDNQQTAEILSTKIGRSPSVIARRLRRLRKSGAIAAEVAVLSDAVAGSLFALVHVQLATHRPDDLRSLHQRLQASSYVQQFLEVSGAFDIVLLIAAPNMDAFNGFCAAVLESAEVQRYETSFVKKRRKVSLAVVLPAA